MFPLRMFNGTAGNCGGTNLCHPRPTCISSASRTSPRLAYANFREALIWASNSNRTRTLLRVVQIPLNHWSEIAFTEPKTATNQSNFPNLNQSLRVASSWKGLLPRLKLNDSHHCYKSPLLLRLLNLRFYMSPPVDLGHNERCTL